jgi:hypothetical protein
MKRANQTFDNCSPNGWNVSDYKALAREYNPRLRNKQEKNKTKTRLDQQESDGRKKAEPLYKS